ncbi:MAG: endolytic transglycosylase MltG [Candidatus Neomarinimicrobiota bacterium]
MVRILDSNLSHVAGSLLSLAIFAGIAFYGLVVYWPQPGQNEPKKIEVPSGSSLEEIAELLHDNSIVDVTKPFVLAAQLMGYEKSIRAGVFLLRDVTSNIRIIHQLVRSEPVVHRITVPEGLRNEQIAGIFQEKLGLDSTEFLTLCSDEQFIHSLGLDVPSLEGFLTPETYLFHERESAETIIGTMVEQYRRLFDEILRERSAELGLTALEAISLASIIEGEAIFDSERSLISAVYHNRLKKRMKLQADPTIQYIIKDGPRRLLKRDLLIESPYNTYLNPGLPSGPINNPGKESILAALNPADVDYLYFVATGEGYHTFTKTEEEHRHAKRKLRALRRKVRLEGKEGTSEKVGGSR